MSTRKSPPPFTKKHRENISKGLKGRKVTEETKRKISIANKGHLSPFRGISRPSWVREKIARANRSRSHNPSDETRLKMSLSHKGKIPWNKGKKTGHIPWNKGLPLPDWIKEKVSKTKRSKSAGKEIPCNYCGKLKYHGAYKVKHNKNGKFYCCREHQQKDQIGENNPAWKKDRNISYGRMHDLLRNERGDARDYPCAMIDKTCKGRMEWASISHNANIDIQDYIPLCCSHHRKYDLRQKI